MSIPKSFPCNCSGVQRSLIDGDIAVYFLCTSLVLEIAAIAPGLSGLNPISDKLVSFVQVNGGSGLLGRKIDDANDHEKRKTKTGDHWNRSAKNSFHTTTPNCHLCFSCRSALREL